MANNKRINVALICGGKYHDFDFARVELLKLLQEEPRFRVKVWHDYSAIDEICAADFLLTYTCDVVPDEEGQRALQAFVSGGKRWFALHATNSVLQWLSHDPPLLRAPRSHQVFMETLGSQFLSHPPVGEYRVINSRPDHPLVQGINDFDTTDELYLQEMHGEITSLLHCHYQGTTPDFEEADWTEANEHSVFYLHPVGKGGVLYLTLGHCRSTYDMQPLIDEYPAIERCSWELPVYYELLRRGLRWGLEE
jgi:type 1 glutamine amidotransferase